MKLIIKLRACVSSMSETHEYLLNVWFVCNGVTYFLNGCVWNAYAKSFKEAKENLKTQPDFCNIIDHLIEGVIIKQGVYPSAEIVI